MFNKCKTFKIQVWSFEIKYLIAKYIKRFI